MYAHHPTPLPSRTSCLYRQSTESCYRNPSSFPSPLITEMLHAEPCRWRQCDTLKSFVSSPDLPCPGCACGPRLSTWWTGDAVYKQYTCIRRPASKGHKKSRNNTEGSGTSSESGTWSLISSLSRSRPAFSFGLDDQMERPQAFGDKATYCSTPHPMRRSD